MALRPRTPKAATRPKPQAGWGAFPICSPASMPTVCRCISCNTFAASSSCGLTNLFRGKASSTSARRCANPAANTASSSRPAASRRSRSSSGKCCSSIPRTSGSTTMRSSFGAGSRITMAFRLATRRSSSSSGTLTCKSVRRPTCARIFWATIASSSNARPCR